MQAPLRLLTASDSAEAILAALQHDAPARFAYLEAQLRPKLIMVPLAEARIDLDCLQAGRLPEVGRDEILAGAQVPPRNQLEVLGRKLSVVGFLRADITVFADSYLLPPSSSTRDLFTADDPTVRHAILVPMGRDNFYDRKARQELNDACPAPAFTCVVPETKLTRATYYLYMLGESCLLLGASGLFIGLFGWLGRQPWLPRFSALEAIDRHPRLLWAVHGCYFGLVVLVAVLAFEVPEVPAILRSLARGEIDSSAGPLGIAGKAYASGSVLRAAGVTFLINFLLGSVVMITLPSVVVPGSGAITAAIRAASWGCALAPTTVGMAAAMRTHMGTVVLEGEGYVLATFFALLIPMYLGQRSQGSTLWGRFTRALILNVKANGLVALVLVIAACYEAVEVIWR
jgi:hypothetical protein